MSPAQIKTRRKRLEFPDNHAGLHEMGKPTSTRLRASKTKTRSGEIACVQAQKPQKSTKGRCSR